MKKELGAYTVTAIAKVTASIEIRADNLEDALTQARALKVSHFVTPAEGDVFDDWDDFEITGLFLNY